LSWRGEDSLMPNQVTRKQMERWLTANGFVQRKGGKTSHIQFAGHGVTVTLPGHGSLDLTKKHVGMIMRQLERAGFRKDQVLQELRDA
jgi:predicted RNA binding protein YcfA (HicA-like mRNA interferase family)